MKKVVTADMVAHLWAHRTQDEARNAGGNFYFRQSTIYSYGSHFPIARFVMGKDHHEVVLFTTRTYSNTTSKHLYMVRSAIRHLANVIECTNVDASNKPEHIENLRLIREDFDTILKKATTARTRTDNYLGQAETLIRHHTRYREAFGLSLDKPLALAYFTFHNVTVSIRAKTAKEAYTLLCEQLSANDGDWHTTTYAEDDGEIRSTEELFPKE